MVTVRQGLRVSTVERSLMDLAGMITRVRLAAVLDDALDRRLVTLPTIGDAISALARSGRPGVAAMTRAIRDRGEGFAVTESVFEHRFLSFCAARGFTTPTTQVTLRWRDRVVVELGGRRGHQQLTGQEHDRIRDQRAAAQGWLTVRVTWRQLAERPDDLAERLADILHNRAPVARSDR